MLLKFFICFAFSFIGVWAAIAYCTNNVDPSEWGYVLKTIHVYFSVFIAGMLTALTD